MKCKLRLRYGEFAQDKLKPEFKKLPKWGVFLVCDLVYKMVDKIINLVYNDNKK